MNLHEKTVDDCHVTSQWHTRSLVSQFVSMVGHAYSPWAFWVDCLMCSTWGEIWGPVCTAAFKCLSSNCVSLVDLQFTWLTQSWDKTLPLCHKRRTECTSAAWLRSTLLWKGGCKHTSTLSAWQLMIILASVSTKVQLHCPSCGSDWVCIIQSSG